MSANTIDSPPHLILYSMFREVLHVQARAVASEPKPTHSYVQSQLFAHCHRKSDILLPLNLPNVDFVWVYTGKTCAHQVARIYSPAEVKNQRAEP